MHGVYNMYLVYNMYIICMYIIEGEGGGGGDTCSKAISGINNVFARSTPDFGIIRGEILVIIY